MLRVARLTFFPLFKKAEINQCVPIQGSVNSFRWCSTEFNFQTWSESLDEPKQKRIRHIQNEVRLQLIHRHHESPIGNLSKKKINFSLRSH